ncbi:hypothetical protein ELQ92_07890 [Labedella populi]|uniref:DUF4878 domain-containing protein n=1 Tax=Labedella populi TaxID=2498850 RepID=A0A3S4C8S8_9MICO|nr:hypothetical protein [Labedella populi]RWZ64654.1 hypothetical protein ELQ92_07890 [Labedella populi]
MVADNNPPQTPDSGQQGQGSAPQWGPPPVGGQPQQNTGAHQPQQNPGAHQPQQNTGAYQPQQNTGAYQPQQNTGAYQPQQNTGAYQPQQGATPPSAPQSGGAYSPPVNGGSYPAQPVGGTYPTTGAYPAGGGGYGATPPGGPSGPKRPDNPNKKKIILFSALAGALVLLLIIGAVVVNVVNSSVYGPDATVRSYLSAIANGDASAANKLADPGVEDEQAALLTDDVFGEASAFIENPKVTGSRVSGDLATVRVSYNLDGTAYDGSIELSKAGKQGLFFDSWKIDSPLVGDLPVYVSGSSADTTEAAINGTTVAFGDEYSLPAYPAVYTVGAPGNDFFSAEEQSYAVATGSRASYDGVTLEVAPTDALTAAVQEAVDAHLDECATSTELNPEGCNLRLTWYSDFSSVDKVTYKITTYPTVEVDEYGSYFDATGGSYTADVTGTTYEGAKGTLPFGLEDEWGITGKIVIDGDTVTIEDTY